MAVLDTLAEFVAKLRYEDLPEDVVKAAKLHVLDAVGCGLLGFELGTYKILANILKEYKAKPESTIMVEGWKTSCLDASFLNAFMINTADIEDTHRVSITHPAAPVVATALALGEREKTDGKTFLTAVVAGYDILARVGMAINPSSYLRGFHATSVCAPFGSAAAASKILGFDGLTTANAIGIAAIQAGGLLEAFAAKDSKPVQISKGAYAGVLAALLAAEGLEGCRTILEGGQFYLKGYLSTLSDEPKTEPLLKGLGEDFEIKKTAIKLHGGCRYIHAPMDLTLEMVRKSKINVEDIKSIHMRYTSQAHALEIAEPKDEKQAIFNSPFGIALLLIKGDTSLRAFSKENLKNPEIVEFMKKVTAEADPELDEEYTKTGFGTIVTIETKDGKTFQEKAGWPRGEPEWPISEEEALGKFRSLAYRVIGEKQAEELASMVSRLEEVRDVSKLILKTVTM